MELNAIAKSAIFFIFVIVCEKMMSYGSLFSSSVFCCSHQVAQTKNKRRERKGNTTSAI